MTRLWTILTIATAVASTLLVAGGAHADWCVDLHSGQNYDCAKDPPTPDPSPHSTSRATHSLRDQLSRALAGGTAHGAAAPDRLAMAQRAFEASKRADSALTSAGLTTDPGEKAVAKKAYEAAIADIRTSTRQLIATTTDPQQKKRLEDGLRASEERHASMARDVGFAGAKPPAEAATPAPPAKPTGNEFLICEPTPQNGVTACARLGRSGGQCQEVLYQGGLPTVEMGWKTCSAADQAQRDAYFDGRPVGEGAGSPPPADPQSQRLSGFMASLSANCREQLTSYLYSSRDSRTSAKAQEEALRSFKAMQSTTYCSGEFARLAELLGVPVPQRQLSARTRSTWKDVVEVKDPEPKPEPDRELTVASRPEASRSSNDRLYDYNEKTGGWDPGEILDVGLKIGGFVFSLVGAFVQGAVAVAGSGYSAQPSSSFGGPSGPGILYRSSSGNRSGITGGRR